MSWVDLLRDLASNAGNEDLGQRAYGRREAAQGGWRSVGATGQPAFQSNWRNYPGEDRSGQFFRDRWGRTYIHGLVDTADKSFSTSPIFYLPIEYRPLTQAILSVYYVRGQLVAGAGTFYTSWGARLRVGTDGAVQVTNYTGGPGTDLTMQLLTLDGVEFPQ